MSAVARKYALSLAVAQQAFSEYLNAAGPFGTKQIIIACESYPGANAKISVEYRLIGSSTWLKVPKATLVALTAPVVFYAFGAIEEYRISLTGVVGGSGLVAWVADVDSEGVPPGLFEGNRAMTVQTYIEANVKNGVQYELSSYNPTLGAGASQDTIFTTGNKPVLVKTRLIGHDSNKMVEARVYKNTVFTPGSGTVVPFFNLSDINPVTGGVVVRAGATISNIGSEFGAPTYSIGSSAQAQSTVGTFQNSGFERELAPNTNYALRVTNQGTQPCQLSAYISWFEGAPDLPL